MSAEVPGIARAATPGVSLELESRPETLTLVRGMLGGVGELLAIDPELLDDLKTAVSEACNNVVLHAYPDGPGPLWVQLYLRADGLGVTVRDEGGGIPGGAPPDDHARGVGLPVIRALTEQAEFRTGPRGGTEVWMLFAAVREGKKLFEPPGEAAADDGQGGKLSGDAVVSVSPIPLLPGVLGRLTRALAASARFSLDRFSDVYLVTDAIAGHALAEASSERIWFAITVGERRLELVVGPFRKGSSLQLCSAGPSGARSPLAVLSDQLDVESDGDSELLKVVMIDHRRWTG